MLNQPGITEDLLKTLQTSLPMPTGNLPGATVLALNVSWSYVDKA